MGENEEQERINEIDCYIKDLLKLLAVRSKPEMIENRFGGEKIECPPECVALYDCLIGSEKLLNDPRLLQQVKKISIQPINPEAMQRNCEMIKAWFSIHHPDIYMVLID